MVTTKVTLTKRMDPEAAVHVNFLKELSGAKGKQTGFEAFIQNDLRKVAEEAAAKMRGIIHTGTKHNRSSQGLIDCAVASEITVSNIASGRKYSIGIFDTEKADNLKKHDAGELEVSAYSKSKGQPTKNPDAAPAESIKGYWRVLEYGAGPRKMNRKEMAVWFSKLRQYKLYDSAWYKRHKKANPDSQPTHPGVRPLRFIRDSYEWAKTELKSRGSTALNRYKRTRTDYKKSQGKITTIILFS